MKKFLFSIIFLVSCSSDGDSSYTCWKAADQARCPGRTAWDCTHGTVPDGCLKADMGQMEGYDWIVCCDVGRTP